MLRFLHCVPCCRFICTLVAENYVLIVADFYVFLIAENYVVVIADYINLLKPKNGLSNFGNHRKQTLFHTNNQFYSIIVQHAYNGKFTNQSSFL
jgi:hypothetical protein